MYSDSKDKEGKVSVVAKKAPPVKAPPGSVVPPDGKNAFDAPPVKAPPPKSPPPGVDATKAKKADPAKSSTPDGTPEGMQELEASHVESTLKEPVKSQAAKLKSTWQPNVTVVSAVQEESSQQQSAEVVKEDVQTAKKADDIKWSVSKSRPGEFIPQFGVGSSSAKQLEDDTLALLADGNPKCLEDLAALENIGVRFENIYFNSTAQELSRTPRSWQNWLGTLRGVEFVYDSRNWYEEAHPTHIRLKSVESEWPELPKAKPSPIRVPEQPKQEPELTELPSHLSVSTEWSATPFSAPYGVGTKDAKELEQEVLEMLADGQPKNFQVLRIGNGDSKQNLGVRFNLLFFQKAVVNNGSWKKWLSSLENVELLCGGHQDGLASHVRLKLKNKPNGPAARSKSSTSRMESKKEPASSTKAKASGTGTSVRALSGGAETVDGASKGRLQLCTLLGVWTTPDGSSYKVIVCDEGWSLTVTITRRSGALETRQRCITLDDTEIWWGQGFKLVNVSHDSVTWKGRNRDYKWTRVDK